MARALLALRNHEDKSHSQFAFLERDRNTLTTGPSSTILKTPKPGLGVISLAANPDLKTRRACFSAETGCVRLRDSNAQPLAGGGVCAKL